MASFLGCHPVATKNRFGPLFPKRIRTTRPTCGAVAGNDEGCTACQLLEACRDHVKSFEGARKILASYQVDPGRQGAAHQAPGRLGVGVRSLRSPDRPEPTARSAGTLPEV